MPATPASLEKFVQYCQQHLKGDEKGEAQNFLDRFFQAFGHEGVKEAGATLEQRVKKGSKKGNTGFEECRNRVRQDLAIERMLRSLSKNRISPATVNQHCA